MQPAAEWTIVHRYHAISPTLHSATHSSIHLGRCGRGLEKLSELLQGFQEYFGAVDKLNMLFSAVSWSGGAGT